MLSAGCAQPFSHLSVGFLHMAYSKHLFLRYQSEVLISHIPKKVSLGIFRARLRKSTTEILATQTVQTGGRRTILSGASEQSKRGHLSR